MRVLGLNFLDDNVAYNQSVKLYELFGIETRFTPQGSRLFIDLAAVDWTAQALHAEQQLQSMPPVILELSADSATTELPNFFSRKRGVYHDQALVARADIVLQDWNEHPDSDPDFSEIIVIEASTVQSCLDMLTLLKEDRAQIDTERQLSNVAHGWPWTLLPSTHAAIDRSRYPQHAF